MRVAIVGHRYAIDFKYVMERLANVLDKTEVPAGETASITFVTGGAKTGVDKMIKLFAEANKIDLIQFEPHFVLDKNAQYSPRDYFTRNRQIVSNCDMLIAFLHKGDSGVAHAIEYGEKKGKPVFTIALIDKQIGDKDADVEMGKGS